ncbi:MAG TPA: HAD hydrolase-like protein [Stellaceae bacterium]|nr:HAD hydrolase-like protein [Stellaceae bacterium]
MLTFAEAWSAYRRAETRLPPKPPPVTPRRIAALAEIADAFDLFVLDAWGVLNIGETPIAGAVAAVAKLRAAGKAVVVLSNDGTREPEAAAERHRRRGFDFAPTEILPGIALLPEVVARLAAPGPLGLIADPPAPYPALTGAMLPLADDPAAYDAVAGFVFLSSDGWSEARQRLLQASLARRPRPLVVGNPDIVSPDPLGMATEPGFFTHGLAEAAGLFPIFCGKPFAPIYRHLWARHPGIAPERVLAVGDTLHTDILGGRAMGWRTLLIEDGFCRGQDGTVLAADCGIWPDFIAPRL